MTPTTLGALPSDKPIPNQRCQIKTGAHEGEVWVNQDYQYLPLGDGAGGNMLIQYQPTYPCWWVVRTNMIIKGVNGGWQRLDYHIRCIPADLDGVVETLVITDQHESVYYREWAGAACFRLGAGTLYTAQMFIGHCSGGTQAFYMGAQYARIIGVIHGEGVA